MADVAANPVRPETRDPRALTSGHLWQVDVVRLLTFTAVIAVHSLAFTEQPDNRLAAGAMMLLQFGRNIFFTISAFVLVYAARKGPLKVGHFWKRRFLYVAVPYVTWTLIYEAYSTFGPAHAPWSFGLLGRDLLYGGAMYHLYFLLVTMQLYLVFPLLLAFVRRTAHIAGRVLIVVGIANAAWLAVIQWVPAPAGPSAWLWHHAYEILPSYAVYVMAGCYAAVHLQSMQRWVQRHGRSMVWWSLACAVAAVVAYGLQLPTVAPRTAAAVLQPANLLTSAAALGLLYLLGTRWASGPRKRQSTIAVLSDASFGVYLAHPLILELLTEHGLGNAGQIMTPGLATVLALAGAIVGGLAVTLAARRTPLSLALAGRPWRTSRAAAGVVGSLPRQALPAPVISQQATNSA